MEGRHTVSTLRYYAWMKIAVKQSKNGKIVAIRNRLKIVNQRSGVDKKKNFGFYPV